MRLTGERCCRMYPMMMRRPIWAISLSSVFPGLPGVLCQAFNLSSRFTTPSKICSRAQKQTKAAVNKQRRQLAESLNLLSHLAVTEGDGGYKTIECIKQSLTCRAGRRRVRCLLKASVTLRPPATVNCHTLLAWQVPFHFSWAHSSNKKPQ